MAMIIRTTADELKARGLADTPANRRRMALQLREAGFNAVLRRTPDGPVRVWEAEAPSLPDPRHVDTDLPDAPEPFLIRHSEKIAAVLILCIWAAWAVATWRL